jgi:hypothetical protein
LGKRRYVQRQPKVPPLYRYRVNDQKIHIARIEGAPSINTSGVNEMNRMTRICFTFTVLLGFMVMCPGGLSAQSVVAPSSQLGIGVFAGGSLTGGGATIQYAITPGIHIGLEVGLIAETGSETTVGNQTTKTSDMVTAVGPYGRFLLEAVVNPFFQVGFRFAEASTTTKTTAGSATNENTVSVSSSELYVAFGLEGFISSNFGALAAVDLLNVPTESGNSTQFGIFNGKVGVEWFFNR